MSKLTDITNLAIRNLLAYRVDALGTLAINAGAVDLKTTTTIAYVNGGVVKAKTAMANITLVATTGLKYTLPIGKTCYFAFGLDSGGTLVVVQGSYAGQKLSLDPTLGVGVAQAGANWVGDGSMPDVPAGVTLFGIAKVVNVTNAFIPGTTNVDAAGVTTTCYDIGSHPGDAL